MLSRLHVLLSLCMCADVSATYFFQNGNPGACGNYNSDSTPLVAIDQAQWYASGSGSFGQQSSLCGKWLTITNKNNGKS